MGIFRTYEINLKAENFPGDLDRDGPIQIQGTKIMRSAAFLGREGLLSMWRRGISVPTSLGVAFLKCLQIQLLLSRRGDHLVPSSYYLNTSNSSETGQLSNFIGEVFAEAVAQEHLGAIKLIHLEELIRQMGQGAFLFRGNNTPDFLGQNQGGDWMAVEAKGTRGYSNAITARAQAQALGIQAVDGVPTIYNAVAKTYFGKQNNELRVRLQNQVIPALLQLALNNVDIDELNTQAFDIIRETPQSLEGGNRGVEIGNETVRFFREDLFPSDIRGLQIRLGIVEGLLEDRNYQPQPFPGDDDQDNDQGIEIFQDGTVVMFQGEVREE